MFGDTESPDLWMGNAFIDLCVSPFDFSFIANFMLMVTFSNTDWISINFPTFIHCCENTHHSTGCSCCKGRSTASQVQMVSDDSWACHQFKEDPFPH